MPFLKKLEVRNLASKYGQNQFGIIALEPIQRGELVLECDLSGCNYYPPEDTRNKMTRAEVLALIEKYPEASDFIRSYTYMINDDLFNVPRNYATQKVTDECVFFNHSCDPNCGFATDDEFTVMAIRNIDIGEELTYHYGCLDSETTLSTDFICKCGAKNCVGKLKYDFWRDPEWQKKYEQYSGDYIKQKIRKLREEQAQKS
jgi:SET domain-containing protein